MTARPPRYGAPELDIAIPDGAQGKTGGKDPSVTALSNQYGRSNDLDTQQSGQQADSERTSLAQRAPLGFAAFRVINGQLDDDPVLEGLVFEGVAAPNLMIGLERPRQDRYGVLVSIDDQVAVTRADNRTASGFEVAAYDVVAPAALDLSTGTYDVTILLVGS